MLDVVAHSRAGFIPLTVGGGASDTEGSAGWVKGRGGQGVRNGGSG